MRLRRSFKAILNDVRAQLVKRKLYYVVNDGVYDLDLFTLESILKYVRDHIVTILLRSEVICGSDDLLDDWHVDVTSGKLLQHALNDTTATLVLAE